MKIQEDVKERQGDACAGSFTHTCLFIFSTQANYVISPDSKVERRFITAPNLLPGAVTSNTSDATSSDLPPYSASLTALWKATKSCLHLSQRLKQFFFSGNTQQIIWKPDTAVCVCARARLITSEFLGMLCNAIWSKVAQTQWWKFLNSQNPPTQIIIIFLNIATQ